MSNLSTIPTGLLGLFGIKNEGKYPEVLNASYSPTMEMLGWLAASNARELISEQVTAFGTVGVKFGPTGIMKCPPGQCWLWAGGQTSVPTTATDFCRFSLGLARRFGAQAHLLNMGPHRNTIEQDAAGVSSGFAVLPGPLLMFPDDEICVVVHRIITAGTLAPFMSGWIYRFPL